MATYGNCNGVFYIIHTDRGGDARGIRLFDKKLQGHWYTESFFWSIPESGYQTPTVLDIEFKQNCRIRVYKHADYPTQYNNPLTIKKIDIVGNMTDVTQNIIQKIPTNIIGNVEYDYIDYIPAGRYQFILNKSRLDMEWVLYSFDKFGMSVNGEILDIVDGSLTVRNDTKDILNTSISELIPHMNTYNKCSIIRILV